MTLTTLKKRLLALIVSFIIIFFIIPLFIVPKLEAIYCQMGSALPYSTMFFVNFSVFMSNNFFIMIPLFLILIFLFVRYIIKFNSSSDYSLEQQLYIKGIIVNTLILINIIVLIYILFFSLYLPIFQMGEPLAQ